MDFRNDGSGFDFSKDNERSKKRKPDSRLADLLGSVLAGALGGLQEARGEVLDLDMVQEYQRKHSNADGSPSVDMDTALRAFLVINAVGDDLTMALSNAWNRLTKEGKIDRGEAFRLLQHGARTFAEHTCDNCQAFDNKAPDASSKAPDPSSKGNARDEARSEPEGPTEADAQAYAKRRSEARNARAQARKAIDGASPVARDILRALFPDL